MKKFLSALGAMVAIAILFTACSKSPDKVLDRKDGKWDAVITTVVIFEGGNSTTTVQSGIFLFENNRYTLTLSNGTTDKGTWTADSKKVTFINDLEAQELDVIKSGRKEQEWRKNGTFQNMSMKYELTYKLKR